MSLLELLFQAGAFHYAVDLASVYIQVRESIYCVKLYHDVEASGAEDEKGEV